MPLYRDIPYRPMSGNASRLQLCDVCEFGMEDVQAGFCRKVSVTYPSVATIRSPEVRLQCQNYMVRLDMPYRQLGDWTVESLRDFKGHYRDERGERIAVPGIASLLTAGADWWFRDMMENGAWRTVAEVPALRREATGRWRLIATAVAIGEMVQPLCLA